MSLALAGVSAAQSSKATLDVSETLFSVAAAMNACGYDAELRDSDVVRQHVRAEIAEAVGKSDVARATRDEMCRFYRDHQQPDSARDLAQYVSLALNVGPPPNFDMLRRESDVPPDGAYVLGLVPLLRRFYVDAGLGSVWQKHRREYEMLVARYHEPVANMITSTDVYLKMQSSGYVGREFVIYLEPLTAPGQVNSRNFGADYYMVVAPENGALQMKAVRHTYLHYLLDPLALKRANTMKRVDALLPAVKNAPMPEEYKYDSTLLVTECLIRAIEARTLNNGKAPEAEQRKLVDADTREGFVLTPYFYDQLRDFEKSPTGLKDAFGDLLYNIDVPHEKKLASEVDFSRQSSPEVVRVARPAQAKVLDLAEERLSTGKPEDAKGAEGLARQALDAGEDPARALFILARAAVLQGDVEGARMYFERTLAVAREPRLVAWSHIYLGRMLDMQQDRDAALQHYQAALAAGDPTPDTKSAAERGLKEPYHPPVAQRR